MAHVQGALPYALRPRRRVQGHPPPAPRQVPHLAVERAQPQLAPTAVSSPPAPRSASTTSRPPRRDVDFWATSRPPEDGTCLWDRLPNEVVANILSHLAPDTLTFVHGVRQRAPHDGALLAVRLTCRLMALHCIPLVRECWQDDAARADPLLHPVLRFLRASAGRARACRRLVLEGSSACVLANLTWRLEGWATILPNLVEVVLSGTERVKLDAFAPFAKLRRLTVIKTELTIESRRTTSFPALESLTLSSATLTDPSILKATTMPALRHLSLVDCRFFKWLYAESRWATDLLLQLDLLELGEDMHHDADVRLLVPLAILPDTLPVLWRVDLDGALVHLPFPRSRAALHRHTFVRLVDHGHKAVSLPRRTTRGLARQASRLDKILDILADLPNLELVLVPHDLWPLPTHPTRAPPAQQRILDECARRGIALRTYERREGEREREWLVPEFKAFLRERAQAASGAG